RQHGRAAKDEKCRISVKRRELLNERVCYASPFGNQIEPIDAAAGSEARGSPRSGGTAAATSRRSRDQRSVDAVIGRYRGRAAESISTANDVRPGGDRQTSH